MLKHVRDQVDHPIIHTLFALHVLAHFAQGVHDFALRNVLASFAQAVDELLAEASLEGLLLSGHALVQATQLAHVHVITDFTFERHIQLSGISQAQILAWQERREGV
ncbi:hypothetical protein D3C86_1547020 [compost metagenome]